MINSAALPILLCNKPPLISVPNQQAAVEEVLTIFYNVVGNEGKSDPGLFLEPCSVLASDEGYILNPYHAE